MVRVPVFSTVRPGLKVFDPGSLLGLEESHSSSTVRSALRDTFRLWYIPDRVRHTECLQSFQEGSGPPDATE